MRLNELVSGTKLELDVYDDMGEKIIPSFVSEYEWPDEKESAIIAAPIFEGAIYPVRIGAIVDVFFLNKVDMYTFGAMVVGRKTVDNIALLKIEITSDIIKIQRRQFFRFDCSIPVKYREALSLNPEYNDKNPFIKTVTRDLSGGGLCVLVDKKIDINKLLEFELQLEEEKSIKFFGKIVRVTKLEEVYNQKYTYELGIWFRKIENKDRETVIKYIFNEQRILRKKGLI